CVGIRGRARVRLSPANKLCRSRTWNRGVFAAYLRKPIVLFGSAFLVNSRYLTRLVYTRPAVRGSASMLFKRQRASVYGIDAYLVDVEVDVGSARTQDFNVVGLPDNAVKESRERIKSALRNSGFEFPHGQGVTINFGAGRCEERRLGLRFADGA